MITRDILYCPDLTDPDAKQVRWGLVHINPDNGLLEGIELRVGPRGGVGYRPFRADSFASVIWKNIVHELFREIGQYTEEQVEDLFSVNSNVTLGDRKG